jgi:gluconolactonase
VVVLSPQGEHLGTILTGVKTGNVAFGNDGYLYIAADSMVQRIRVTATGAAA